MEPAQDQSASALTGITVADMLFCRIVLELYFSAVILSFLKIRKRIPNNSFKDCGGKKTRRMIKDRKMKKTGILSGEILGKSCGLIQRRKADSGTWRIGFMYIDGV